MAKCSFQILFDNDQSVVRAGETISGKIVAIPDTDINCKSLNVSCSWSTHGRGNVASGVIDTVSVYQGQMQAGKKYEYPFKLKTATWPPTYYGTYINVSHYVEAVAKVSWSTDPKASREIQLIGSVSPDDLAPAATPANRAVLWIIGLIFGVFLMVPLMMLSLILVPLFALGFAIYWFVFRFLPKRVTGNVEYKVEQTTVPLGGTIKGHIAFTPRRSSKIDGVTWTLACYEKCSSGSGSKRQSHSHEALKEVTQLLPDMELAANDPKHLEFECQVPPNAPLSFKLTDNEVVWTGELRIAIPGWPDWSKTIPLVTKPSALLEEPTSIQAGLPDETSEADDPWLTEVFQQVKAAADDETNLTAVVEAVSDQTFELVVDTKGAIDEPYEANLDEDGNWLAATDPKRRVSLSLHLPASLAIEKFQWKTKLRITAQLVGLDSESGSIMMNVQTIAG